MQEIPRTLLLPPPALSSQRPNARVREEENQTAIDAARNGRRSSTSAAPGQAFLTLIESGREDTVELKGKQFRFRPYNGRGSTVDGPRDSESADDTGSTSAISAET